MLANVTIAIALVAMIPLSANAADVFDIASKKLDAGDFEQAARLLVECSREGDIRCDYLLGRLTLAGKGVERDAVSAAARLETAANAGLPAAQSNLGLLYASGQGVEQNLALAAELHREAAESGDTIGQAALGAAYFLGEGVPKDLVQGYVWTGLAAARDNEKARAFLPVMEKEMTGNQLDEARTQIDQFRPQKKRRRSRALRQHRRSLRAASDSAAAGEQQQKKKME